MAVTEFLRYRTQPKWFARSVIMATSTPVPVREPKNMGHPPRISGSKAVSGVVKISNARTETVQILLMNQRSVSWELIITCRGDDGKDDLPDHGQEVEDVVAAGRHLLLALLALVLLFFVVVAWGSKGHSNSGLLRGQI